MRISSHLRFIQIGPGQSDLLVQHRRPGGSLSLARGHTDLLDDRNGSGGSRRFPNHYRVPRYA
jgi:hypothetical protein